jgi:hypothetical protein
MNPWHALEETRQHVQARFDAEKPGEARNRLGQFATPFPLARQIMAVARTYQDRPIDEIRFLEPAVGLGAFYSALLDTSAGGLPQTAVGFEIDAQLVQAGRALWQDYGFQVRHEDFTVATAPADEALKFNLVVTNPPYVRHHHLSQPQKHRLTRAVTHHLGLRPNGLMGLYGYFLLLAHPWMQADGLGVWLIPTEFMDVNYGAILRTYLTHKVELLRVHRYEAENVQFADADVTSTVLFLRNRRPAEAHRVVFSTGSDLENPQAVVSVPLLQLRESSKWSTLRKRQHPQSVSLGQNDRSVIRLGDLFDIKRGVATGANKFFILSRAEAKRSGIPDTFLKPILPSPRYLRTQTIIEADALGHPLVEPQLMLLDCVLPKEQLAEQHPALYHYILQGEKENLPQRYLLSRRDPWYRQEKRAPAPIVCGYMARKDATGRSIRFYRNKSQAIAANVYLMLYPKPVITHYYPEPEGILDQIFEHLLALEQQEIVVHGRTYGGGLDKMEPHELMQVALGASPEMEALLALLYPLIAPG